MLDLEARVHLEEVEPRRLTGTLHQKLHRSRIPIPGGSRNGDRGFAHPLPQRRTDRRRRTLLNHFLVAALNRAFSLEQMNA